MNIPSKIGIAVALIAIHWYYFNVCCYKNLPKIMGGYADTQFKLVEDTFRQNIDDGIETGAAFAVFYKGKPVVDLWGGYADRTVQIPWRNDTLTVIFSASKGVAAILLAKFVEKGYLDYKQRVSHYWPEFAQNNKEAITVEMLVNHQAGLNAFDKPLELSLISSDYERFISILAAQKPNWIPGTQSGYHAFTFGLYVDVLLTKVDPLKRSIEQIYQEEIMMPFGIDFYQGLPYSEHYRAAPQVVDKHWWEYLTSYQNILNFITLITFTNENLMKTIETLRFGPLTDREVRRLPCSSFNGYSTARALAKLYGNLVNTGNNKGKDILSKPTVELLDKVLINGTDAVLKFEIAWSVGLMKIPVPTGKYVFGHLGYGGQLAFGDKEKNIGVAYITNHLDPVSLQDDYRWKTLLDAVYKSLEAI
ncbi:beta-lactamase domain-containing protein 2 isoform X1 [Octopus sinensis]|uniref:Beta-lactamase domain-containing protein 2 isoform X1 n=1 Tax=Octopus sinensis TaxID=2607531 RepID=A0A6P7SZ09_9MOLL|nr:beta-lactamase domain-containing protein 2 isoform X1 [Octopus sinensis]